MYSTFSNQFYIYLREVGLLARILTRKAWKKCRVNVKHEMLSLILACWRCRLTYLEHFICGRGLKWPLPFTNQPQSTKKANKVRSKSKLWWRWNETFPYSPWVYQVLSVNTLLNTPKLFHLRVYLNYKRTSTSETSHAWRGRPV